MSVLTLPHPDSISVRAKALVFEDPQSRALLARIEEVARTDGTILLCGETGTGKEIVARRVHERSARREGPFVGVTCGELADAELERALFGVDSVDARPGWFEAAHGGTLFLDEVGDIPLATQAKLLRVLQEGAIVRHGAQSARRVDVRLIAATNVNLHEAVRAGRFREDLFRQLNETLLTILPLRERPADILPTARHFLELYAERLQLEAVPRLTPDASRALLSHVWPGNIRELESAIHHALLIAREDVIHRDDLGLATRPAEISQSHDIGPQPEELLDAAFVALLSRHEPNLFDRVVERLVAAAHEHADRNPALTARLLGIGRSELRARLQSAGEPIAPVI